VRRQSEAATALRIPAQHMKSHFLSSRTFRYALVALALGSLSVFYTPSRGRTSEVPGITIENFGRVNEHLYRGSQPNHEQFAQLRQFGIRTVIDLRSDYKKEEETWVRELGMNFFRIPLKTRVAATEEQSSHFFAILNDPANWPVYIHCKGGRHRTGAMSAIYRITHDGWTADQAWHEMKAYDFDNGLFGGPSAQKKYVFEFYQRQFRSPTNARK
jgi:protein tyrosine/serine phosphatase